MGFGFLFSLKMPHWIRHVCHSPTPQKKAVPAAFFAAASRHWKTPRLESGECVESPGSNPSHLVVEDLTMLGGQDRARPWCSKFGLIMDPRFFSQGFSEHEGQPHLSSFYKSTTPNKIHWISCRPHRCWDPFSNVGAPILGSWVFGCNSCINCKEAQRMSCVYGTSQNIY